MIERVENISPEAFHAKYVAKRKPCIFTTIPDDLQCLKQCQDLEALRQYAGDVEVAVEPISDKGTFGTSATKQYMSFASFLRKLQDGERLYLTTQYSEEDDAEVVTEPLKTLSRGFYVPVITEFACGLTPAKINLWLGSSSDGTSSGLHHDFHDNFYILLSGQKKFRIFPPSWKNCKALKLSGQPHEIFSNGLISYGSGLCSDGLKSSFKAQIRVDICESDLKTARKTGMGIEEAEKHYENAMDMLLDAKLVDDDEAEDGEFVSDQGSDSSEAENSAQVNSPNHTTIPGMNEQDQIDISTLPEFTSHAEEDSKLDSASITDSSSSSPGNDEEPPSFSSLTTAEVARRLTDESLHGLEFDLEAGQMLYLPASYFHEVVSTSANDDFHMAVNYWFYPPDSDDSTYVDSDIMAELQSRVRAKYINPTSDATEAPLLKKVKK